MLDQLNLQSLSLFFFLLFVRYGYHISKNSYFICYDQEIIRNLFERLRNYSGQKESYPTECGRFSISAVRDLTTGYDSNQPNNRAVSAQLICGLTCSFFFTKVYVQQKWQLWNAETYIPVCLVGSWQECWT